MGLLLSKSTNDDLLIQALTIELAAARQVHHQTPISLSCFTLEVVASILQRDQG